MSIPPSRAYNEVRELSQIDLNQNGVIDYSDLMSLSRKIIRLSFSEKMMEISTTHPNMLKRIQRLATLHI